MSSITPPRDDNGTFSLRVTNAASAEVKAVNPAAPAVPVHPGAPTTPRKSVKPVRPVKERRRGERRGGDRRQGDEPVLLDTRTHRERRRHAGQRRADDTARVSTKGVDDYV